MKTMTKKQSESGRETTSHASAEPILTYNLSHLTKCLVIGCFLAEYGKAVRAYLMLGAIWGNRGRILPLPPRRSAQSSVIIFFFL
jgi:hypothetical protein